jgi:tripartite-type tricarboxylate transporter receptor subunit TctC
MKGEVMTCSAYDDSKKGAVSKSRSLRKSEIFIIAISLIILGSFTAASWAAEYPTKPIQMAIAMGAGGSIDLGSKIISQHMSKYLKQPLISVYKPGGGMTIAVKYLMTCKPDGYTVLVATEDCQAFYPRIVKGADYGIGAITPLFGYGVVPLVFVVREDAPWQTLPSFIDDAKKNPNKFKYGSYGAITGSHFVMSLINKHVGMQTIHVPFASPGEMITALLGGHVNIVPAAGAIWGLMKAGKIRALAVSTPDRTDLLPGVPTLKELGLPFTMSFHHGFSVPNGTPKEIQETLIKSAFLSFQENGEEIKKAFYDVELVPAWADQETYKKVISDRKGFMDSIIEMLKIPTYDK